jgi:hypothetical protein
VSSQLDYWDCFGTRSNNEPPNKVNQGERERRKGEREKMIDP